MEQNYMNASVLNVTHENNLNTTSYANSTILNSFTDFNDQMYRTVLNFVFYPVVFIIGILGNISTIILFLVKKQKTASITFILGLAISDLLFLSIRLITHIYNLGHQFFNEAFRNVRPNSLFWSNLSLTPQRVGFLFILIIVMERITAVWYPFQLKQIWTTRRSRIISFILVSLTLGDLVTPINILIYFFNERVSDEQKVSLRNEVLIYNPQRNNFFVTWSFTYRIVFDILPLPLAFFLNIILIIGIRKNAFSKQNWNMKSKQRIEKEARMTRMLLTISVMFILLCGPYNIITLMANNNIIDGVSVPVAVYDALLVLCMLNSVINFLMYGISDPSLRKEYLELWRCRKGRSENPISGRSIDNHQTQI